MVATCSVLTAARVATAATSCAHPLPHSTASAPLGAYNLRCSRLTELRLRPVAAGATPPARLSRRIALCASAESATEAPAKPSPDDIVVVSAVRTPLCKAKVGGLKNASIDELVATVLKATLERTGVKPEEVNDICFGSGLGPSSKRANEARIGQFLAGFPPEVPIYTVNRQCAAGLQSIADVAAAIQADYYNIGIAGGVESMSLSDLVWEGSTNPRMEGNQYAKDCLVPMGITSDNVAKQFNVPREVQDEIAVASHAKAAAAQSEGRFMDEIVPVEMTIKDPETGEETRIRVDRDDGIRGDYTMQKLSKLRPCFSKGGTTTVGNACQTTDGAAAVMLMKRSEAERRGLPIMAALRSFAVVGVPPAIMGIGPAVAIPEALKKAHISKDNVDIFEINEAFGSQAAYCFRELGLPMEKVNPNGGGIALGHPIGCTGARQTVTLLNEMVRRSKNGGQGAHYGVVSMCTGSGMGAAAVFENGKA